MSCLLAGNATMEGLCFNHGDCIGSRGTGCICHGQYDPLYSCSKLTYASLHGVDAAIKIVYCCFILPVTFLTLLEIIFDVWLGIGKISIKRPLLVCKGFLLLFGISRLTRLGMEIYESLTVTNDLDATITTISMIGLIVSSPIYPLIVVNWISMLLMAKTLSDNSTGMRRFRFASFLLAVIMSPLIFVFSILAHFNIGGTPIRTIATGLALLVLIIEMVGSTIYLVKLFIWLSDTMATTLPSDDKKKKKKDPKLVARRRTYPILVINAAIGLGVINVGVGAFVPLEMKGAWIAFILHDILGALSTTIPFICYYLFSQNYFTKADGWYGRGYWLVLCRDATFLEEIRKYSVPSSSAPHHSSGKSSRNTPITALKSEEEDEVGEGRENDDKI